MTTPPSDGRLAETVASLLRLHRRRRWGLRCLVVAVGVCLVLTVPLLTVAPRLAGTALLLLPVFWAACLLTDAALLDHWRASMLRRWCAGEINLGVLAEAVATLPMLPRNSTAELFRMLPVLPPLHDRDLSPAQRAALAASSHCRWAEETSRSLLPSALLGILAGAGALAMLSAIPFDLRSASGIAVLAVGLPLARAVLIRRLRRQLAMRLDALTRAEREHVPWLAHEPEERAAHTPARRQRW